MDAKQLEALATSSAFGAPTTTSTQSSSAASGTRAAGAGGGSGAGRAPLAIADHRPSGLNAITTAATDGEGSSVGVLAAGLLLITALLGATTLARRRSHAL